jgi:hypothetical protein
MICSPALNGVRFQATGDFFDRVGAHRSHTPAAGTSVASDFGSVFAGGCIPITARAATASARCA